MTLKDERNFRKWVKKEKAATRRRREGQKEGVVCKVCGKKYYEHEDYAEINRHSQSLEKGESQWVKK